MADHVYMLVLISPKIAVLSFMGDLKGKSALMMFDKHANLKDRFGNRHFWPEGGLCKYGMFKLSYRNVSKSYMTK